MTSGKPLTEREQIYILRWAGKKTWGQIADELVDLSPDGIRRNPTTLSMWYNKYHRHAKAIQIIIPESIELEIEKAGLDDHILSFLLSSAVKSFISFKTVG